MQNRGSRALLFGSRATSGPGSTDGAHDIEALEADNQLGVEGLRGSAGMMKDIALHIETDVNDQNRMLDRVDKRFDSANSLINSTMQTLNDMVNDRTSSRMCAMIAAFFFFLVIMYYMMKK